MLILEALTQLAPSGHIPQLVDGESFERETQFPFISKSVDGQTHLYPFGELTKQAMPAGETEHSW